MKLEREMACKRPMFQSPGVPITPVTDSNGIRYVSRYRITMHYRPNAIKTNADEKRGKFLSSRFKGSRTKSVDAPLQTPFERYLQTIIPTAKGLSRVSRHTDASLREVSEGLDVPDIGNVGVYSR